MPENVTINIMRKFQKIKVLLILLLLCARSFTMEMGEDLRHILFTFYKHNVNKVDILGNFEDEKKIIIFPMKLEGKNKWTISLNLIPNFYYYKFFVNREYLAIDPSNKVTVRVKLDYLSGKFSFLEVYPREYETFIKLARHFISVKEVDWGLKMLQTAAKKYPSEIEPYVLLGKCYIENGLPGFAFDAYIAGLENNPQAHELRYLLALACESVYMKTGKKLYRKMAKEHLVLLQKTKQYHEKAKKKLKVLY